MWELTTVAFSPIADCIFHVSSGSLRGISKATSYSFLQGGTGYLPGGLDPFLGSNPVLIPRRYFNHMESIYQQLLRF